MILTKITGVVPSSICGMFSFKMPQRTLVGKSGPATRMQTLPKANPAVEFAEGKKRVTPKFSSVQW